MPSSLLSQWNAPVGCTKPALRHFLVPVHFDAESLHCSRGSTDSLTRRTMIEDARHP